MKKYQFDSSKYLEQLVPLLQELEQRETMTQSELTHLVNRYAKDQNQIFSKNHLVQAYQQLAGTHGLAPFNDRVLRNIQMKPTRTLSGVTPVTVLTKPFPCPGKCIFCPNDIRMPKSYLADEPGAQRAERNAFDPYLQTYSRLQAFRNTGHNTDKVELIILGGTWSYYPEAYQIWFIKECFLAMNDFSVGKDGCAEREQKYQELRLKLAQVQQQRKGVETFVPGSDPAENKQRLHDQELHGQDLTQSYNQVISDLYVAPEKMSGVDQWQSSSWDELAAEQRVNETAQCRNVGLVIETRPDNISETEVLKIRRLGCTKTQIGFQSLQDEVLAKNHRGHDVAATRRAVQLLRQAGFKIHAHWMPNLYGSNVEADKADYLKMFADGDFCPDELKIYPCSLIESAELMQYYQRGEWRPYTEEELLEILTFCFAHTPPYCRLTRVVRDIPSTDIVVGNKKTNFRQIAQAKLQELGQVSQDIRARELRQQQVLEEQLILDEVRYDTSTSTELFLQYIVKDQLPGQPADQLAGFLRLSLPKSPSFIPELADAAMIREVHVYGQVVSIGQKRSGKAQHLGLGTKLLERAKIIAHQAGFARLAVISAVGTREYYRKRGFVDGELYQLCVV